MTRDIAKHAEFLTDYLENNVPDDIHISLALAVLTGTIVSQHDISIDPQSAMLCVQDLPMAIKHLLEAAANKSDQPN